MNHTLANLPPQEFRATKGGGAGQIFLFFAMAAGCGYLTYSSLTPDYWTDFSFYELEAIGKFVNLFPIPVRVLMCGALMVMCLNAARIKLARNASDTPLLILSSEGVSGFKNGFAKEHTFISWGDFKKVTVYNKDVLHFKAKSAIVSVSLKEIGVKYAEMLPLIEAYQLAWAHGQILGQTLGQRQPQQQYAQVPEQRRAPTREREFIPAQAKRPEPQPAQFMKPNVPDFGKRMTRL